MNYHKLIHFCLLLLLANATHFSVAQNATLEPGYPDRSPRADVLPLFKNPPKGYGNVPFYWWIGDTLTKERLLWQMDQLKDMGVTGLQVNYCHTDAGGASYGLTFPSQPALFSDAWWKLFGWFMQEAKKRNMSVSLSDYTLGAAGQGWYVDEMLAENPGLEGSKLEMEEKQIVGGSRIELDVPKNLVSATAYKKTSEKIDAASAIDLFPNLKDSHLSWNAPAGEWSVYLIHRVFVKTSFDPMNPLSGAKVVEKFFQRFEDHNPGEAGKGLNFFFSDELNFGIRGFLWNDTFADEFRKRKGYDILPNLQHLFVHIDSSSYKTRLDYNDVMVDLSEKGFFKPVYDWHTSRGMIYGCDHGGRGQDVTEFGDYFRTQRWMSGPGADQPGLDRNIIKSKVASSIAHLYERPRTWLEGFYGSGWGTSTDELAGAIFANYAMGFNLLSLHGLYYTTHGSRWEWAAPDNHFRQPYWQHAKPLMKCTERLGYLLSQGRHVCDVAIMYPVEPVQASLKGNTAVQTAFDIAKDLYPAGIDFDFMDHQSLERSVINQKNLQVSGESYKVLILPAMAAVRYSTIEKALQFYRAGGIVMAAGALPEASERVGANDPNLQAIVREIFGDKNIREEKIHINENKNGGKGIFISDKQDAGKVIKALFTPDFFVKNGNGKPYILHRKAGQRDIYFVYGLPLGTECFFRTKGSVELWDPWTGAVSAVKVSSVTAEGTVLKLPLDEKQPQLLVFSKGEPQMEKAQAPVKVISKIIDAGDEWAFELKPTLDNKFGDYRLPAFNARLGVEAWKMKFAPETASIGDWHSPSFDDSKWATADVAFGQQFWKLGPLPEHQDYAELEAVLCKLDRVDPDQPVQVGEKRYYWQPYEFSWRWGLKHDAGHQGYHGLKGKVNNDIFSFGLLNTDEYYLPVYPLKSDRRGNVYFLWSTVPSDRLQNAEILKSGLLPEKLWLNHQLVSPQTPELALEKGFNPLLLRYENTGRGYFIFKQKNALTAKPATILATDWFLNPAILPFDARPQASLPAGLYRLASPPGTKAVYISSLAKPEVWIGEKKCTVVKSALEPGRVAQLNATVWKASLAAPEAKTSMVAIRLPQLPAALGGAAVPEPVVFDCGPGKIDLGDLFMNASLQTYSGGMWYRKTITVDRQPRTAERVMLDLGKLVASAEVWVNGQPVGIKTIAPWQFDITGKLKKGQTRIEILVYNTLGNHFLSSPSRYIGRTVSGLMGPVTIEFSETK